MNTFAETWLLTRGQEKNKAGGESRTKRKEVVEIGWSKEKKLTRTSLTNEMEQTVPSATTRVSDYHQDEQHLQVGSMRARRRSRTRQALACGAQ